MKCHGLWLAAALATLLPFAPRLPAPRRSRSSPRARAIRSRAPSAPAPSRWRRRTAITVFHYIPTSADNARQQTALVDEALSAKRDAIVFTPGRRQGHGAGGAEDQRGQHPAGQCQRPAHRRHSRRLRRHRRLQHRARDRAHAVQGDGRQGQPRRARRPGQRSRPRSRRLRGFKDALKEFPNVKVDAVEERASMPGRPPPICSRRC